MQALRRNIALNSLRFISALTILLCVHTASAAPVVGNAQELIPGLEHIQNDDPGAGAVWFNEKSIQLNDPVANNRNLTEAGFAAILSCIAFEKAADSRAYTAWAKSIELFLRARTSWPEVQKSLAVLLRDFERDLKVSDPETRSSTVDANMAALVALEAQTGFVNYGGPVAGLSEAASADNRSTTVVKSYFARPLKSIQEEAPGQGEELGSLVAPDSPDDDGADAKPTPSSGRRVVAPDSDAAATADIGRAEANTRRRKIADAAIDIDQPRTVLPVATDAAEVADKIEVAESADTTDVAEVTDAVAAAAEADATDAAKKIDAAESVDPTESTDPAEAVDAMDVADTAEVAEKSEVEESSIPADIDEVDDAMDPDATVESLPEVVDAEVESDTTIMGLRVRPGALPDDALAELEEADSTPEPDTDAESTTADESDARRTVIRYGPEHRAMAEVAWQYFTKNRLPTTGFVNSIKGYSRATLWDVGSGIAGIVSAEQLGLISRKEFQSWMDLFLRSLGDLPLYNNELPNREYVLETGRMVGRQNRLDQTGTGWSALDIGRTLVWLRIAHQWYPGLREDIESVIDSWDFQRVVGEQQLNGSWVGARGEKTYQEGRLGYEQYAATGYLAWGHDVARAVNYTRTATASIEGLTVPYDTGPRPFLTTDPFVLATIEMGGVDAVFTQLLDSIYGAHKSYWDRTGKVLVANEDSLDKKPWFSYRNLVYEDKPWHCVSYKGVAISDCPSISTKGAFGFSAIFEDPYAEELLTQAASLKAPRGGYYAGRYENGQPNKSLNINTNAVVLEALLYLKRGRKPFLDFSKTQSEQREVLTDSQPQSPSVASE